MMRYAYRQFSLRFLTVIIVALAFLSPVPVSAADIDNIATIHLSLEETVSIAYRNNKDVQIREQGVRAARAGLLQAYSPFWPQVDTAMGYTYTDAVPGISSATSTGLRKDPAIFFGYKNDNMLQLTFGQTIYNGGEDIANLKKSRVAVKAAEQDLRFVKLGVEFEAKRLYYGLLLAYETARINKNLVDQADAHYRDVRNRFDQGTSSKFDLLQSRVYLSTTIPPLIKARNAIEVIKAELKKLISIDMTVAIEPTETLTYTEMPVDEQGYLVEAYQDNPRLIMKSLGIDMSGWAIEAAKSGYYPDITGTAGWAMQSNSIGNLVNPWHDNWTVGVKASLSIFDGFSTKAKVDDAKAKYAQEVLGKENLEEQVAVDIKRGCLDLVAALAIIQSQKDSIEEAREALRISEIRYDNGVGTNLDVIDSMVSLSQVEKNLADGIYDYLMAEAHLDRTMGRETFPTVAGATRPPRRP